MAPVVSGIVVSHIGTTYGDGREETSVVKSADRREGDIVDGKHRVRKRERVTERENQARAYYQYTLRRSRSRSRFKLH